MQLLLWCNIWLGNVKNLRNCFMSHFVGWHVAFSTIWDKLQKCIRMGLTIFKILIWVCILWDMRSKITFYGSASVSLNFRPYIRQYTSPNKIWIQLSTYCSWSLYGTLILKSLVIHFPFCSRLLVVSRLLFWKYLMREIREKRGAYGAGASCTPGIFSFFSYRYVWARCVEKACICCVQ